MKPSIQNYSFRHLASNILGVMLLCFNHFVGAQDLESYIEEAEAHNPEVQAYELKYHIAKEKVVEANMLPNTEISAGVFVSEPETRTGAQKARFSVKQMVPWFGTITARENYASSLAEVDYLDMVITRRKLGLSVSQSYYSLFATVEKRKVLEENIQLLGIYEQLALTALEVGKASAVDVLRLQIRQNELHKQKEVLKTLHESERTRFNNLLNRDRAMEVILIDSLPVTVKPEELPTEVQLHPELEKYDRLYESVVRSETANQMEAGPNIGFGLDYIPVAERPEMDFSDNGKDIFMPMVSLSIPIFNSKYKSRSAQNRLQQEEIVTRKSQRRNQLETILSEAVNAREAARITYGTLLKNLESAKDAEEILIRNYETGTIDFNDVLDIQELQLKFRLDQIDAVKNYFSQMAIINYLRHE